MSKAADQASTITLSRVLDLLVDHRIKLDALELALKVTNPLVHELYIGNIENLQTKEAADLKRKLAAELKSKSHRRK